MSKKFDSGQLKGAYSAGYAEGVKDGIATMHAEGWRRATEQEWHDIKPGEIVKALRETMTGWIGFGRVIHCDPGTVTILKLNGISEPNEITNTADFCINQIARKIDL